MQVKGNGTCNYNVIKIGRHFYKIVFIISEGFNKNSPKDHNLLLCLLMTASDLSDQTKPWDSTKHIAVSMT